MWDSLVFQCCWTTTPSIFHHQFCCLGLLDIIIQHLNSRIFLASAVYHDALDAGLLYLSLYRPQRNVFFKKGTILQEEEWSYITVILYLFSLFREILLKKKNYIFHLLHESPSRTLQFHSHHTVIQYTMRKKPCLPSKKQRLIQIILI